MADVTLPNGDVVEVPDNMSLEDVQKHMNRYRLESTLKGPAKPEAANVLKTVDPLTDTLGVNQKTAQQVSDYAQQKNSTDKTAMKTMLQTLMSAGGGGAMSGILGKMAPGAMKGLAIGAGQLTGQKVGEAVTGDDPSLKPSDALSPALGAAGGLVSKALSRNAVGRSQALVDALQGKAGTTAGTVQEANAPTSALDSLQNFFKDKVSKILPKDNTQSIKDIETKLADGKVTKTTLAESLEQQNQKAETAIDALKQKHTEQLGKVKEVMSEKKNDLKALEQNLATAQAKASELSDKATTFYNDPRFAVQAKAAQKEVEALKTQKLQLNTQIDDRRNTIDFLQNNQHPKQMADLKASTGAASSNLKNQQLQLETEIAKHDAAKASLKQQSALPENWPKEIADITQGPEIAKKIANTPLTSEAFANTLYEGGPRTAKVAMAMVANHPDSAALTTEIRKGYTQKLLRETFDTTTNKFVGSKIRENLIDNSETKAMLTELYPGNKSIPAAVDDLAEICRAGGLEPKAGMKKALWAGAKGILVYSTLSQLGHTSAAQTIGATTAMTAGSYVPWGKAVDAMMRNDALRKSAVAWVKSGAPEQAAGTAGQLFKTFLRDNAEPIKSKTP